MKPEGKADIVALLALEEELESRWNAIKSSPDARAYHSLLDYGTLGYLADDIDNQFRDSRREKFPNVIGELRSQLRWGIPGDKRLFLTYALDDLAQRELLVDKCQRGLAAFARAHPGIGRLMDASVSSGPLPPYGAHVARP